MALYTDPWRPIRVSRWDWLPDYSPLAQRIYDWLTTSRESTPTGLIALRLWKLTGALHSRDYAVKEALAQLVEGNRLIVDWLTDKDADLYVVGWLTAQLGVKERDRFAMLATICCVSDADDPAIRSFSDAGLRDLRSASDAAQIAIRSFSDRAARRQAVEDWIVYDRACRKADRQPATSIMAGSKQQDQDQDQDQKQDKDTEQAPTAPARARMQASTEATQDKTQAEQALPLSSTATLTQPPKTTAAAPPAKAKRQKAEPFSPPTLEEVKAHFRIQHMPPLEAEKFHGYYCANGWRVGKNPMRSWKGAAATWRGTFLDRGGQLVDEDGRPDDALNPNSQFHPENWARAVAKTKAETAKLDADRAAADAARKSAQPTPPVQSPKPAPQLVATPEPTQPPEAEDADGMTAEERRRELDRRYPVIFLNNPNLRRA